jgi:hypothetical protein
MVRFYSFIIALSLGFLAGCSTKNTKVVQDPSVLPEVFELIQASTVGKRPPSKTADLDRKQSMFPHGYTAVKSGDVVVLWSTPLKGEGEAGKGETILAYEKNVPTDGGYVLFSAGTVKKMTAAQFEAAPKPAKK